jgi:hypothetical protein
MKKTKSLSLSLWWVCCIFLVSGAYAQDTSAPPDSKTLGDIEIERSGDSSLISVRIDPAASSEPALSEISLAGKLSQSGKLRSLTIRFCADSGFVPSGEVEIIVSDETKLTMYSSSVQKVNQPEKTDYTLTFLNGLDSVIAESDAISESNVFLNLYSNKNKTARLGVPTAFFNLLGSPPR